MRSLDSLDLPSGVDAVGVEAGMQRLQSVLQRIVVSQMKMFNCSDPKKYEAFVRPYIFGWKGNNDFPHGVLMEGVGDGESTFLRGETGAQSTIIPSLDAFLGIGHKEDILREMLQVGGGWEEVRGFTLCISPPACTLPPPLSSGAGVLPPPRTPRVSHAPEAVHAWHGHGRGGWG